MHPYNRHRQTFIPICISILALVFSGQGFAQQADAPEGQALYDAIKSFTLQSKTSVSNLVLKRDRGEMTFNGDFYFTAPLNGKVTGAVFIGQGSFRAEAPAVPEFEKSNLKRFIDSEVVESDFETAVLRFTDDTFDVIGQGSAPAGEIPGKAQDLAEDLDPRLLEETGANISARLAISIANNESPGFFMAQFDKGKLDRFTFLFDPQCRIPNYIFKIDAGEKVIIFQYNPDAYNNDIWIATYSEEDFENNKVSYSDDYDIVDPMHYNMEIDVRNPRRMLRTKMRIDFKALTDGIQAIPMVMNENISAFDDKRRKDSMMVLSTQHNGQDIACFQEEWEVGLTFFLPKPMAKGDEFSVEVAMEGDFIEDADIQNSNYPFGNSSWYPRHGYLKPSTFDLVFRHKKGDAVSSVGTLVREAEEWPDDDGERLTEYKMESLTKFVSFVSGNIERFPKKRDIGYGEMEINYYSLPSSVELSDIKESFILEELGNVLYYFSNRYGPYPYDQFRSTYRSLGADRPYATMVTLNTLTEAQRNTFRNIGSDVSKQWWGCIVTPRSYRDQWLEDGLVNYSGLLYVLYRMKNIKEQREFLDVMRYDMKEQPRTDTGVGEGKIAEIGPIILGSRLRTRNSTNSSSLVVNKGALVIRMLHYLFSNPTDDPSTVDSPLFFAMMRDFTDLYAFRAASTDDFISVANKYFPKTPIAQTLGLKDLNWFFQQYLYQAVLPSYSMEYNLESGADQVTVTGKILTENAPETWFMPLPVVIKYSGDREVRYFVYANGPETEINLPPLPAEEPESVELDPDWWIFSEKTEAKKQ